MDKLISEQAVIDAVSEWLYDKTRKESIETVIKAIPSAEPSGDAVSRQEILNKINEVCFSEKWKGFRIDYGSNGQRDFLIDYIKQMLPVNPQEPKIGHWIITYPYGKQNPIYECPHCHVSNSSVFKNFCPNCGAKMIEPQKSEGK